MIAQKCVELVQKETESSTDIETVKLCWEDDGSSVN
jgi:hypothetical protein